MCLVNALAFEAEWESVYFENDVRKGVFTLADGSTVDAGFQCYMCQNRFIFTTATRPDLSNIIKAAITPLRRWCPTKG